MEEVMVKKEDGRRAKRMAPDVYQTLFDEHLKGEYQLLTPYVKSTQQILVRHNRCGEEFLVFPSLFIRHPGCRTCYIQKQRLTPEAFKERFDQKLGNQFELKSPYVRSKDKITVQHRVCEKEFQIYPNQINHQLRCPFCKKQSFESETHFLATIDNEAYQSYHVAYQTYQEDQPVQLTHTICGKTFEEYPGIFAKKPYCPHCDAPRANEERFRNRMEGLYQGKYAILNQFKGYIYPLLVQHQDPRCMKYSYPMATNFSTGRYRCPHCEGRKKTVKRD